MGTGSYGSFSSIFNKISSKSIFTLTTNKQLVVNFEWVADDNEKSAEILKKKLDSIGFQFPENYKEIRPSIMPDEWLSRTDKFIDAIKSMVS